MRRGIAAASLVVLLAAVAGAGATSSSAVVEPQATARLSLFKRIENLDSGASEGRRELWTMHALNLDTGQEITGDGLNGVQSLEVVPGRYQISESGGVGGYRFQDWTCSGADVSETTDPTPVITVPDGGQVTCTVDNEAIEPTLTLVKEVVGGSASPTDWTLQAQGPTNLVGPSGSAEVTNRKVRIGDYTLSEQGGPTGYTPSDWDCGDAVLVGNRLTVGLDENITCTIRNTSAAPQLTLRKEVVNDGGGPAVPGDFTLTGTGPTTISGPSGSVAVTGAGVSAGTYALSESSRPGYTPGAWTCDGGSLSGAEVTLDADDIVTCTVTNTWTGGSLTLLKEVAEGGAPPQAWQLVATDDAGFAHSGTMGQPAVTGAGVPAGSYTLTELGPDAYDLVGWTCTGGELVVDPSSGGPGATYRVTVGTHAAVECTATNTLAGSSLTLVKEVVGPDGGPAADPAAWTLAADGATPLAGASGSPAVTHQAVTPGDYTLSESGGPLGYAAGDWVCDGATAADGVVSVGLRDDVTCTITNTWDGGTLTLVKEVAGGGAPASAWDLTATGTDAGLPTLTGRTGSTGVTAVPVPPGDYDLTESDAFPLGYELTDLTCTGSAGTSVEEPTVTVGAGDDVTCTFTNSPLATQHLTLIKLVNHQGGGFAPVTAWTLAATDGAGTDLSGPSGSPGVSFVAVPPGDYTLSESGGPDGYRAGAWVCQGADVTPGGVVTIEENTDVACVITNSAIAPRLTLVKDVVGGPSDVDDWRLFGAGSPGLVTGFSGSPEVTDAPVTAGTWRLFEVGSPLGYSARPWTCADAAGATVPVTDAGQVTLALAQDVTCTVQNVWEGGRLTLLKEVTGGPAAADSWELRATGRTGTGAAGAVISGPTGSVGVTSQLVPSGEFELAEGTGPAGYRTGTWTCTEVGGDEIPVVDGHVAVAQGEDVRCLLTNHWTSGTLTLVKEVDGGSAPPGAWTLAAEGVAGSPTDGVSISGAGGAPPVTGATVLAGDYVLAESGGPSGYEQTGWDCGEATLVDGVVSVAESADVTCTVTNTAVLPHLTLVKEVDNTGGGTAGPDDFTLHADGPEALAGVSGGVEVSHVTVEPGGYALTESGGPEDYDASGWTCTGGTVTDGTVEVSAGGDVTCTVVNTFVPAVGPTPTPTDPPSPTPVPTDGGGGGSADPDGPLASTGAEAAGAAALAAALALAGAALVVVARRRRGEG
ncbi:hypothetical protein ACFWFR_00655 [Oerskovia sp. NPDC060287]|uniref:prealbumin-like fold domain-containing protein n=1 Tax=Oerskovia sp. NPDC060287 TaxID=3347095 RepID=UPI003655AE61